MATPFLTDFIAKIHESPSMAVLVVTGGGSQALANLFVVLGASRTVLEAVVPYSDRSMREFLGHQPEQAVSADTAAALSRNAHERALALRPDGVAPVLGIACTAALVTDHPRKGEHRAHVAVCRGGPVEVRSVALKKNARNREGEERVVADLVLYALGRACGVDGAVCATRSCHPRKCECRLFDCSAQAQDTGSLCGGESFRNILITLTYSR